jgi:hypothetical protein
MARRKTLGLKRVRRVGRSRKAGPLSVTRAEFNAVRKLVSEGGEIISAMRRELQSATSQAEANRRTLETQFTRIAQLQLELDDVRRKATPGAA